MSQQRKKILVTGASGFVGKALTAQLLAEDAHVTVVSRDTSYRPPKDIEVFYGDLRDPAFSKKIIEDIDMVYYLAAYKKNIAVHTGSPFDVASGNIAPLVSFLEAVKDSKVKQVIYLSSTNVEYAWQSDDRVDGYVLGKYVNELILDAFTKQTNVDVKIVRVAPIYGPGNDFNPVTANLIPAMIAKIEEACDDITVWGRGVRKMQFIYIDDLIRNLLVIPRSEENLFTIGNNQAISVKDLVIKISKSMGKDLSIIFDTSKPDKSTKLSMFKNVIEPETDIDDGLEKTIKFFKKQYA